MVKNNRTTITPEIIEKMKEMKKKGSSFTDISLGLKISYSTVLYHLCPEYRKKRIKLSSKYGKKTKRKRNKYMKEYQKKRYSLDPEFRDKKKKACRENYRQQKGINSPSEGEDNEKDKTKKNNRKRNK